MKLSTLVGVLALCAVAYAAENGVLLQALTPDREEPADQTQALEPAQPQIRQKRGLLLAAGAGLAGLGLLKLKAGVIGAGVVGAGLVGAKAGLIGGALASKALYAGHGHGYGGGGWSYGGYGGHGGGYGGGYHYAPAYYTYSYPSYPTYYVEKSYGHGGYGHGW